MSKSGNENSIASPPGKSTIDTHSHLFILNEFYLFSVPVQYPSFRFIPSGSCGSGFCQWVANDKDGRRYIFGSSGNGRKTDSSGNVVAWALERVEDNFGVGYSISYTKQPDGSLYPAAITYNNRNIQFIYETRSDNYQFSSSSGSASALLHSLEQRLARIKITAGGSFTREYNFTYEEIGQGSISRLKSISRSGDNVNGAEKFTDSQFNYTANAVFTPGNSAATGSMELAYKVNIPLDDKTQCVIGVAACYEAGQACPAGTPDQITACKLDKAKKLEICQYYQQNYLAPCTGGVPTILSSHSAIDLDGDDLTFGIHAS